MPPEQTAAERIYEISGFLKMTREPETEEHLTGSETH
jgi:preprotein translocase subunit Sss1